MSGMRIEPRRRIGRNRSGRAGAALARADRGARVRGRLRRRRRATDVALPADPGRALEQSAAALREQGTFTFEASFTRVKATTPGRRRGVRDVEGRAGPPRRSGPGRARAWIRSSPDSRGSRSTTPTKFDWARKALTVVLDGERQSHAHAREGQRSHGLIGRYPDEVEALDDLLAGRCDRACSTARAAPLTSASPTTRRRAGRLGIPAELSEAFKQALYGPRLELEAWIEERRAPHKLSYAIHLKPMRLVNFYLPAAHRSRHLRARRLRRRVRPERLNPRLDLKRAWLWLRRRGIEPCDRPPAPAGRAARSRRAIGMG